MLGLFPAPEKALVRGSRLSAQPRRLLGVALLFFALAAPLHAGKPPRLALNVGNWIWSAKTTDRQECHFVREFTIPQGAAVRLARLLITADNSYHVYLDGQLIGQGGDWRVLIEYDVSMLLRPGEHILAVSAVNDFDVAGLVLGLRIELEDRQTIQIVADETWKIAPNGVHSWLEKSNAREGWPAASVVRPFAPETPPQVYHAPVSRPIELALWQRGWFQIALALVTIASLGFGLFFASRLLIQSRMEKVVRRERARIAEDLHDDLGGGLTQLVLLGETTRREFPVGSEPDVALARLSDHSRGLLRAMNETVWLINSRRDTIRDFASYVAKYAESFFQNTPVRCRFEIEPDLPPLPCDLGVRRNMFLAVKEALNNILRHAQATRVEIQIGRRRQELVVVIRDNGRGFDPRTVSAGNGLGNMELRAREAGGKFTMHARQGEGAALEFRMPLQPRSRLGLARFFRKQRPET